MVVDLGLDGFVVAAIDRGVTPALALARAANELAAEPGHVAGLAPAATWRRSSMEQGGELSATQAKTVLAELSRTAATPARSPRARGFERLDVGLARRDRRRAHRAHPDEWSRYRRATRSSPSSSSAR